VRRSGKILGGALGAAGLALVAALVLGVDPGSAEAKPGRHHKRHHHRDAGAEAASDAGAGDGHDPGCLYGRVLDGHTGEVRCLSPEELTPPGPYDWPPPPDAGGPDVDLPDVGGEPVLAADAGAEDAESPHLRPTKVRVGSISFDNGDVPRAKAVLERLAKGELSKCASEHGGVRGSGSVELKFLVRARGRAEGVDVGKVKGVPRAVVECLVNALARRAVGAPTTEPVGVTVVLELEEEPPAAAR
jgi:hypothetical protein